VSTTVTVKEPDDGLPCESDALQLTACGPRSIVDPDAGVQLIATGPSTASFAEAEYVTTAPAGPVASTEKLPGIERFGPMESQAPTVTENDADPGLPCASLAEHVTGVVVFAENVEPEAGEQSTDLPPSTMSSAVGSV
jgi:hypothetical protein